MDTLQPCGLWVIFLPLSKKTSRWGSCSVGHVTVHVVHWMVHHANAVDIFVSINNLRRNVNKKHKFVFCLGCHSTRVTWAETCERPWTQALQKSSLGGRGSSFHPLGPPWMKAGLPSSSGNWSWHMIATTTTVPESCLLQRVVRKAAGKMADQCQKLLKAQQKGCCGPYPIRGAQLAVQSAEAMYDQM